MQNLSLISALLKFFPISPRRKSTIAIFLFFALIGASNNAHAQVPGQVAPVGGAAPIGIGPDFNHQVGYALFYLYGFNQHIFEQFTGNAEFANGESPIVQTNVFYEGILTSETMGVPFPGGMSLNLEYAEFRATTASTLPAAQNLEQYPDIDFYMRFYGFGLKVYLYNPMDIGGNGYLGLGGGTIDGRFSGNSFNRSEFNSTVSYVKVGGEYMMGTLGIRFEARPIYAKNVEMSTDPFGQAKNGKTLVMDFSGLVNLLVAFIRF